MSKKSNSEERELLSCNAAEALATSLSTIDPLPDIPPSLLSAEHIKQYVLKTGLIAPFYEGKRLKKASYEGRIGKKAYRYADGNDGKLEEIEIPRPHGTLLIPANSIVFVECDIQFRLPDYIALRYNLQIRHVHRGLLLGTGPLVDPGYWGALCIPIHNLTSEDYVIPSNEGLIWIEFTKTTGSGQGGSDALQGDPPTTQDGRRGYWEPRAFVERASKSLTDGVHVPIRSSIPEAVEKASKKADKAISRVNIIRNIGVVSAFAIFVATVISIPTFLQSYNSIYQVSKDYVDNWRARIEHLREREIGDLVQFQDRLSQQLQQALQRIEQLESRMLPPTPERQGQQGEGVEDAEPQ
ncbi:hypothetical protein [Nitratireductor thuwali]|uniref:Deoxycytidine triphosphate deaminase n=1 Tax=Nitratireductor thuwali TaxID=2267699 RepID=A0ABY5MR62_9HYPH|nr:Deoxycytidine triphosphate deaminase [Nitratireductor thuwali]